MYAVVKTSPLANTLSSLPSRIRTMPQALYESSIKSLPLLGRGKVRDIYAVNADTLLIVTTDRLSAFDVILPDPIPKKGEVLQAVANAQFFHRLLQLRIYYFT